MIQYFKRPLIDKPNPLKALRGRALERNIYALIKSRASNAIPVRFRYFRAIHVFLGLIFLLIPRLSLCLSYWNAGEGQRTAKGPLAWLSQGRQAKSPESL